MKKALIALAIASIHCGVSSAAVWYYDISAAAGLGGSPALGNWASGAGGAMWSSSAAGTDPMVRNFSAASGNEAWFGGTPANVPVTGTGPNVRSITFDVSGYSTSAAGSPSQITLVNTGSGLAAGTIHVTTGTATINNPLQGTIGYIKTGAGTLSLTNVTVANHTITGPVTVSGGTLQLATSASIGGATGDITLDGGTLRNNTSTGTPTFLANTRGIVIGAAGGTIDVPGTAIQIYTGGSITGAGNTLTKSGTGTFRNQAPTSTTFSKLVVTGGLFQSNIETGFGAAPGVATADAIVLDGGGLGLSAGVNFVANRGIRLDGGGGTFDSASAGSVAGIISGTGSLTKLGTSTWTLTNANNSYQGSTTITGGRISIDGDATLGNGTGTVNLNGGALNTTATRGVTANPVSNPINLTASSEITTTSAAAAVDLNLTSNSIGGSAGTLTFRNDGADAAGDLFDPRFSGSGFNFARPIVIDNGATGLTRLNSFNGVGTDQTFSGVISGNGSFRRSHATAGGSTTFTNDNTYSGGTIINNGTLYANNTNSSGSATGTGQVTISGSGTLAGTGYVSGPVVVNSGGAVSPGASIESLDVGNLTFNNNSSLDYEIDSSASTADLVNARLITPVTNAGDLNLSGTVALNAVDLASLPVNIAGIKFTLIGYAGAYNGGTFAGLSEGGYLIGLGLNDWRISYIDSTPGINGGSGVAFVTITAQVPEASAFFFGGLACAAAGVSAVVARRRTAKAGKAA